MAQPFTCNLLDNRPRFTSKTFFYGRKRRREAIHNPSSYLNDKMSSSFILLTALEIIGCSFEMDVWQEDYIPSTKIWKIERGS